MSVEGYLQKRGAFKRWSPVYLRLQGDQVSVIDLKDAGKPNAQAKDVLVVEHVERLDKEELGFTLHFAGGASRKGLLSGAKEKWLLRAESRDTYNKWWSPLQASLQSKRGGSQPAASPGGGGGGAAPAPEVGAPGQQDFSYGLPPTDPRTDLPIALVPEEHGKVFAFLKMAVIHWFGVVKQLGSDFDTSENIAVLGDKCVYICSPTADVQRCIRVADITKVLVAQDSKKELYAILVMPTSIQIEGKPDALEFDMMFHSGDIKRFVRYLRTVYIHQTQKMLPLEQLRDKTQLESEIRLQKPDLWILNYWQPMFKEHLARILEMWASSNRHEENDLFKQRVAQMLDSTDCIAGPPVPQPEAAAPVTVAVHGNEQAMLGGPPQVNSAPEIDSRKVTSDEETESDEEGPVIPPGAAQDPFGRLLIAEGLAQYYKPLAVENNMTIDLLTSELIDETDLEHWGVTKPRHRRRILALAHNEAKIKAAQEPPKGPKYTDIADDDDLDLDDSILGRGAPNAVFDDDDIDIDLDVGPANPGVGVEADETRGRAQTEADEGTSRADLQAAFSAFAPLEATCDTSTPLGRFLAAVKLPQYYDFLTSRDISLETLACGLVDDASLKLFGIEDASHREAILKGIEDPNLVGDHALGWITEHKRSPLEDVQKLEGSGRKEAKEAEAAARAVLVQEFTEKMPAPADVDISDPLGRFLGAIGLPQYYWSLSAKDMSLEVLTSDLVDDDDLKNHCDIENNADRRKLRVALKDTSLVARCKAGEVPPNSWSISIAAQSSLQDAQSKIAEIGGLGLSLGNDLLGGSAPAAPGGDLLGAPKKEAAATPTPAPTPAAPKPAENAGGGVDLLGGGAGGGGGNDAASVPPPAAAPPASSDLLGSTPPPSDLKGSPTPAADDLLGGGGGGGGGKPNDSLL